MDIAITGASGLIGTALSAQLRAEGHRVVEISRSASGPDSIVWDPMEGRMDRAALEGLDAIVHLAGEPIGAHRWNAEVKRAIHDSRVRGTTLLAESIAALRSPPRVLVSGSAIGFYGSRGDAVLDETSSSGEGFLADVCRAWETATRDAEQAGTRVVHLRTGLVLSNEGGAMGKMLPLFRLGLGGRMGSGRQWWSWVSIDDEVGLIRWAIDTESVVGPLNATGPAPVTNREFTSVLGKVLGRPTLLPVPSFGPKLLLGSELADELLFASQRVLPSVALDGDYAFAHPTLETALRSVLGRDDRD